MDQMERRSLSVLVDNEAGVLSQVSRMFSRKGYNIESLAVGTTDDPAVSRITIEVMADEKHTNLLCNQLRKLLPVHSVKLLNPENSIRRELILIKVNAASSEACNRVIQVANIFRASIIDVSPTTLTLAMIGEESKAEAIAGPRQRVRYPRTGAHRHGGAGTRYRYNLRSDQRKRRVRLWQKCIMRRIAT